MWESNNLDSSAGEEPGVPEQDRGAAAPPHEVPAAPHAEVVGAAQPRPWTGPVLQTGITPSVFSALASAATAPANGTNGSGSHDSGGTTSYGYDDEEAVDDDPEGDSQVWSPEATAARERAQARWREMSELPALPPISLSEEEAAALLSPEEHRAFVAAHPEYAAPAEAPAPSVPRLAAPGAAPWLPAPLRQISAPATAFGPVGRKRSPGLVVLLSVLTLGVYALWWHHRVNREMGEFDPRMSVDPGNSTWAVALPWMIGWLVAAAAGARWLLALGGTSTSDLPFSAGQSLLLAFSPFAIPYLELLIPFSAVAVVMTNERARSIEERVDIPADRQLRPAEALGWLAVPVVGGLVGMARLQRHLNGVWGSVSS